MFIKILHLIGTEKKRKPNLRIKKRKQVMRKNLLFFLTQRKLKIVISKPKTLKCNDFIQK